MLVKISKGDITELEQFKDFIRDHQLMPPMWINHTEWTILRERFYTFVEKVKKQVK